METCPCGSGRPYEQCCGPHHDGTSWPETAEATMRARYCAFVKHAFDFLERSLHSKARATYDRENARQWALGSEWLGLEIVATEAGGPADEEGKVEFIAKFKNADGAELEHHERATFVREHDRWAFLKGASGREPIKRAEDKVNRNGPCPCGSGKKYKKCCLGA
ncbi:MAG: YchJ family protein [Planctomycetota bacterium]